MLGKNFLSHRCSSELQSQAMEAFKWLQDQPGWQDLPWHGPIVCHFFLQSANEFTLIVLNFCLKESHFVETICLLLLEKIKRPVLFLGVF
jgi:hypothetical protein